MKQILQDLKTGTTHLEEVPCPAPGSGHLVIASRVSLVSTGTERMLVDFGRASLLGKARQQPDKVRQVLDKVQTDGLMPTLDTVRSKLNAQLPMGYSNVGTVLEAGDAVRGFAEGDRVVSNGGHAQVVRVAPNLCARVPDGVDDDAAAFTVLGAIALQGVRLIQPSLGECVVVTGLGLVGLLAVQLLKAHGCRVLGIDFDTAKCELARRFGAEAVDLSSGADPVAAAQVFSRGRGVDAVLIAASTASNEPIHQAATMCRKRGRIVLVGVVGMEMSRADFYEKELTFQVSCSYGPGRYDPAYEDMGQDYPVGFVRWTEQRNFEAVLDMMAAGRLDVAPLISHRFAFDEAPQAYQLLSEAAPLGILLEYASGEAPPDGRRTIAVNPGAIAAGSAALGFIGAGNYAGAVLIPAFAKTGAPLVVVSSATGVSAVHVAKKHGIRDPSTDTAGVIASPELSAVVITPPHNPHAALVASALAAGKHVFVEKPLAIDRAQLQDVTQAYAAANTGGQGRVLMVGFNRRYSPLVARARALLRRQGGPATFVYTVNAGSIPASHWIQDPQVGGGRVVGEVCHFIDLLRYLADAPIAGISAMGMHGSTGDTLAVNLAFQDGSLGSIVYAANGHRQFPKERLEIFAGGAVLQLDNFRALHSFGWLGCKGMKLLRQDKGQSACTQAFIDALRSGDAGGLIPFEQLVEVAEATFDVVDELAAGRLRD